MIGAKVCLGGFCLMVELIRGWSAIHGVTPSIYDLYADMHGASAGQDYDDMGQTRYFWTWTG